LKDEYQPFAERKRMTRLGEAVSVLLRRQRKPIIEDIDIWEILEEIYKNKSVSYLRGDAPTSSTLSRTKLLLSAERVISRDHNYRRSWRVNELPDIPADEAVCLMDRGTCISHLSAMQIYKISERRPLQLYITVATNEQWREMVAKTNHGNDAPLTVRRHHPPVVRFRKIDALQTKNFPNITQMRGSFVRATEIGQTFLDMLESPERCGGMSHVLDVFNNHTEKYLKQIVERIDRTETKLTKVRAGYIISELLGISNPTVESWSQFAQRGGSQKLDPKAVYASQFSERWMLSLNV
jgi:predicted transcriptional regulator of viral defense system